MATKQQKAHDGSAKQQRVAPPELAFAAVFTVPEFCEAHRISRALFYILAQDGRAPRIIKAGRRTLISHEAAQEWRRRMEAASVAGAQ